MYSIIRRRFAELRDAGRESGQSLVEYALILMLVALLTTTALSSIGVTVSGFINDAAAAVGGV